MPFQRDVVNDPAAQQADSSPAPLRGLPRKFWKSDEVERLGELAAAGMAPALIASELSRSEMSVRHAARYRGIALTPVPNDERRQRGGYRISHKRRRWSQADIAQLKAMAKNGHSAADVGAILRRTEAAVKLHAKRLLVEWHQGRIRC